MIIHTFFITQERMPAQTHGLALRSELRNLVVGNVTIVLSRAGTMAHVLFQAVADEFCNQYTINFIKFRVGDSASALD